MLRQSGGFAVIRLWALLLTLCLAAPVAAQDKDAVERQFQSWLDKTIWPQAWAKGVSRKTFDAAFDGVTLNWKLPDLVPPGTRAQTPKTQRQAEFGSPAHYMRGKALRDATAAGQRMAKRHAKALALTEAQSGVPGRIILAIWGRETGYGRVEIKYNAFRVLGTKGFMSTRSEYFTKELIAALVIKQKGYVSGTLRSSWAGALGQPQFMPTNFLEYARDGDGDGKRDIWASQADTFASIAAYLVGHGWVSGRDWGFEVKLPSSMSCTLEGPDQSRSIAQWAEMGITRVSGRPFPEHELRGKGSLMLPAGRNGPAFIVTPNFYVLKDYNFSDLYALFVGHVGDRIDYNMKDFRGSWGSFSKMYRSDVAAMQRGLERQGYDVGGADGLVGFKTRRSIGQWQERKGQRPTCFPDAKLMKALAK
ncbi:MAG: lytic murein transglycosylase [Pseudomonadota bacterium]